MSISGGPETGQLIRCALNAIHDSSGNLAENMESSTAGPSPQEVQLQLENHNAQLLSQQQHLLQQQLLQQQHMLQQHHSASQHQELSATMLTQQMSTQPNVTQQPSAQSLSQAVISSQQPSGDPTNSVGGRSLAAELLLQGPTVLVREGLLRGKVATSALGQSYLSFQGIPYARPPLGALRFRDALPAEPWTGVRNATSHGCKCPQIIEETQTLQGCEDCLLLNVYTPKLPQPGADPLPVMFWIHGGGFVWGSGNNDSYGPDYLISEGVVLVTINYRLSSLGFLFLKEVAPGNVGLKDQVAALRWVNMNIAAFNGDPERITIFGESAGGSAVNWHMLSPMTRGLFQGAICESGAILWDMQWKPYETSLNLARAVGCYVGDDTEILECLRHVDPFELILAAKYDAPLPKDRDRIMTFTFNPVVEETRVPGVETFITGTPEELLKHGCQHDVPFMTGISEEEWILTIAMNRTVFSSQANLSALDSDWRKYVFPETHISDDSDRVPEAMNELRNFFLDGQPLTYNNIIGYEAMLGDLQTAQSMYYSVKYMAQARKSDIYVYCFTADQDLNYLKAAFNLNVPGASHADELGYLFRTNFLPNVSSSNPADLTRRRMVRLWANFAKYGNPTPMFDPLIGAEWPPYTNSERFYMDLGAEMTPAVDLHAERVRFWGAFYRRFGLKGERPGWRWNTCPEPSKFSFTSRLD